MLWEPPCTKGPSQAGAPPSGPPWAGARLSSKPLLLSFVPQMLTKSCRAGKSLCLLPSVSSNPAGSREGVHPADPQEKGWVWGGRVLAGGWEAAWGPGVGRSAVGTRRGQEPTVGGRPRAGLPSPRDPAPVSRCLPCSIRWDMGKPRWRTRAAAGAPGPPASLQGSVLVGMQASPQDRASLQRRQRV